MLSRLLPEETYFNESIDFVYSLSDSTVLSDKQEIFLLHAYYATYHVTTSFEDIVSEDKIEDILGLYHLYGKNVTSAILKVALKSLPVSGRSILTTGPTIQNISSLINSIRLTDNLLDTLLLGTIACSVYKPDTLADTIHLHRYRSIVNVKKKRADSSLDYLDSYCRDQLMVNRLIQTTLTDLTITAGSRKAYVNDCLDHITKLCSLGWMTYSRYYPNSALLDSIMIPGLPT